MDRALLVNALTLHDEHGALIQASKAIEAMRAHLKEAWPAVASAVLKASGVGTVKTLKKALRTAETANKCTCSHDARLHTPKCTSEIAMGADCPCVKFVSIRAAVDVDFAFDETNPRAVAWVQAHSTALIEGLSETTREEIRDLVEGAFDGEYDTDDLANQIEELIGDATRAETIARTETMRASNQGQLEAWDQATEKGLLTGSESLEWITTPDDRLCPICEPLDGQTAPRGGTFEVDGDRITAPPAHPRCRCTVGLSF